MSTSLILGSALVLLGAFTVSLLVRNARGRGEAEAETRAAEANQEARRKLDEVLAEPVAEEDEWLRRQRARLRRLRDEQHSD